MCGLASGLRVRRLIVKSEAALHLSFVLLNGLYVVHTLRRSVLLR